MTERAARTGARAVLMIWDGLRPDMVTPERTPNLYRLAAEGVRFARSHAVFPTVTRVNSASISTGTLPAAHGIPGNTFYARAINETRALNTGNWDDIRALQAHRNGQLLARPTLAELIATHGGRTAVVSTGSPGSALIQHPDVEACGDLLCNPAIWYGTERATLEAKLGPMPEKSLPNTAQNAWFTRLITDHVLPEVRPTLLTFWHTDPDHTQHARGIDHPDTLRAIGDADANLGALLVALERLDLRASTNLFITSDHGFCTISGHLDVAAALIEAGLKQSTHSADVIVTGTAIYLRENGPEAVARVTTAIQRLEGMGLTFSGARGAPVAPGTLPIAAVGVDGALAPDILFSPDWNDAPNAHGVPGSAWSPPGAATATHGSIAPWDVHNTMIAAGPDFKRGLVSETAAGNPDIAPTLAHLLGLSALPRFDGRVLHEALAGDPNPGALETKKQVLRAEGTSGTQHLQLSHVGETVYVDYGWVQRASQTG